MTKTISELKTGITITIVGIVVSAIIGFDAWVATTLYTNNGQIGSLNTSVEDTKNTTHEILSVLLSNQKISPSQVSTTIIPK